LGNPVEEQDVSNDDLKSKVGQWLAREGYPRETRVAHALARHGFQVTISDYYKDVTSGEYREIDVVAELIRSSDPCGKLFRVFLVIECKRGGDKPWVAFTSTTTVPPFEGAVVVERPTSPAGFEALVALSLEPEVQQMRLFRLEERPAYGLTQAFTNGPDLPHKALSAATNAAESKALAWSQPETMTSGRPGQVTIAFPFVLIESPLLETYLDASGDLNTSEVDVATLTWHRPTRQGNSHGHALTSSLSAPQSWKRSCPRLRVTSID
jgi:hypothetical protein